jgi:curved DNA-binding protein CbpA
MLCPRGPYYNEGAAAERAATREERPLSDERVQPVKSAFDATDEANANVTKNDVHAAATKAAASATGAGPLDEDVDLALDLRQQLLAADDPEIDHYALLGVETAADKSAVKRAYFKLAARFHPDRHFRKKLGSFKPRLEAFFSRLTIAQETLTNDAARAEYDSYLESRRHSRRIEALFAEAAREAERAEETIARSVQAEEAPASSARRASEVAMPPPPSGAVLPPIPANPAPFISAQARRDALARRLLGGRPGGTASVAPPPPSSTTTAPSAARPSSTMTTVDAMNALRRRYEERVRIAKTAEARKCVAAAEQSLAAGDVVKAANAYRIAAGLVPNDAEIERRSSETQAKADGILADTYSRQAAYEEKNGTWAAAARSWIRVCQARPNDPQSHTNAAAALLKAGGDMRQAARLAQRVCDLEPNNPGARILLAEAYMAAELSHSARRELEAALKLGGHPATIDAMLKRLGPPT